MSIKTKKSVSGHQELSRIVQLIQAKSFKQAQHACLNYQKLHGLDFNVLTCLSTLSVQENNLLKSREYLIQALEFNPEHILTLNKCGVYSRKLGFESDAGPFFKRAIAAAPQQPEAYYNLANLLMTQGKVMDAIQNFSSAIECKPDFLEAYNNLAIALTEFGRPDEAVKVLDTAIGSLAPSPMLYVNKAKALQAMSLRKAAIVFLRSSSAKLGDPFELLTVLADMETLDNDFQQAEAHYLAAMALQPRSGVVCNNYANMLHSVGRLDEAMANYKLAADLEPQLYQALQNVCNILNIKKDYDQTLVYLDRVRAIEPNSPYLTGMQMNARMHTCTWDDWDQHCSHVEEAVKARRKATNPFPPLAFFTNAALMTQAAALWVEQQVPPANILPSIDMSARAVSSKIRVGYFSADLHSHATALLMAGVFEAHDREHFEWVAFSFGPDDLSSISQRVRHAFDRFVDVRTYGDRLVAQLARELEIDIAIDLKGFTQDGRAGIFAERAAPIQVNYLGYPGSMGAPYMDYLIADHVIIPDHLRQFYTESVVRLPHCYQANDSKRPIADQTPTRLSVGLPEAGRVLCSFNNNYKITPTVFGIWMRVLHRFPDCVLWLLEDNERAVKNLRKEAEKAGIDPDRLVFAPRLRNDLHLARHRLADLFVDTYPCNAHTTASDALWAGLPLVTCAGETFASRVAASLLTSMDLQDCITDNLIDYEAKIYQLLESPVALYELRKKTIQSCATSPVFDTQAIARQLEMAYRTMYLRHREGLVPEAFDVPA
jgi:predicted O-linked N-acetylglucosamine transferase (SPINDLY family)